MPHRALLTGVAAAAVAAWAPSPLHAQTQAPGDQPAQAGPDTRSTSYQAAFFTQYAPRTALDIARRVPGFALDLGNADTRGFAGAAGNVVFNGARPSSKAETLEATLARIPANRVVRVDVGPGDLYGAEYAGKSQVLNVILSADAGIDGNVSATARRHWTGYVNTDVSGSTLIKRGAHSISLSAGTGRNKQIEEGTDDIRDADTGAAKELRVKRNSYFNRDLYVSGSWALERSSDDAMRLNGRWSPGKFDLIQDNRVVASVGAPHDDNLVQRFRNPLVEVGGDVTRPLAGGALKLVALATRRRRNNLETYVGRDGLIADGAQVVGGIEQIAIARRNETIGRINWTRSDLFGLAFEAGIEGVLNTLDSSTELFRITPGGGRVRVDLPLDEATVEEKRAEAFVNVGKNLAANLRIDGGLNFETSRLTVSGDTEANRSLKFFKPSIAVDWKPGGGWHTRLSIRRTVAQLDFYDFISVAELSNDRVNAGNAELLPQRAWEIRGTVDRPILGEGQVKIDFGMDRISMLQDQILIEGGFTAPGNLGTGTRRFVSWTVDAPLAQAGLAGTRLTLTGTLQKTRVLDPISGQTRRFSDFFPEWQWRAEVRRDAGNWSYGTTMADRDRFSFFRGNEIDTMWNGGVYGTAFVEFRPDTRTAMTLDIDNLLDTRAYRERLFFAPNRSNLDPSDREVRLRDRHRSIALTIKRSFGGGGGGGVAQA